MARKTFISYKHSEAQDLRDRILKALGDDSTYYRGETSESPDISNTSSENIKKALKEMIFNTSVLIVIISPNMFKSKWIDWELEYCLSEYTRKERTSKTNGVVGVIMRVNGSTDWIKIHSLNCHGNSIIQYKREFLYPIINKNRYNSNPKLIHCSECNTYDFMNGSYITLVNEDTFLSNPVRFIENAYQKSEDVSKYVLTKER
jgi:hypothetical protein